MTIESEDIDIFPLFLTCFYRGWIDHIHTWGNEGLPAYSLIAAQKVHLDGDGEQSFHLDVSGGIHGVFHGFEFKDSRGG